MRSDEKKFLMDFYEVNINSEGCRYYPRDLINDKDFYIHHKRAWYILDKWSGKGWYDYGVTLDMGWLTDKGKIIANDIIDNIKDDEIKYFKILTNDSDIDYKEGYVKDINDFNDNPHSGLYFTNIENIFAYVNYGNKVCKITVPKDVLCEYANEDDRGIDLPGWRADKLLISDIMRLDKIHTIKYLISEGADITCNKYEIFIWAKDNNYIDIYQYMRSLLNEDEIKELELVEQDHVSFKSNIDSIRTKLEINLREE